MTKRHTKTVVSIAVAILWCTSLPALGQQAVKPGAAKAGSAAETKSSPSSSLAATVMKLKQIRVKDLDTDVPMAAKPLLTKLKQELSVLIQDTLNKQALRGTNPEELRTQIVSRLKSIGVAVAEPQTVSDSGPADTADHPFGDLLGVTLETPDGFPDLLVATTTVSIPCGEDSSLYVFNKHSGGWELLIEQEINDYDSISDAQGSLGYAVGPADHSRPFFVVVATINPWCTSNWQGIRYTVMRAGKTADQPAILFSTTDTVYLGGDEKYRITVTPDGFTMKFDSSAPDNSDEISAMKQVKYKVSGNKVVERR